MRITDQIIVEGWRVGHDRRKKASGLLRVSMAVRLATGVGRRRTASESCDVQHTLLGDGCV